MKAFCQIFNIFRERFNDWLLSLCKNNNVNQNRKKYINIGASLVCDLHACIWYSL